MNLRRHPALLAWTLLALAVAAGYGWTLRAAFLGDDFAYVQRFWQMEWSAWPRLFLREWSEGIWGFPLRELRPMSALLFLIDARLWGNWPGGYHLTNLFLHLACSGLVLVITRDVLARGWRPALLAGVLFALHPAPAEAVIWITGRADLLAALGFLAAFHAHVSLRMGTGRMVLLLAWGAYAIGIFAKEFCLVLPLAALAYDLAFAQLHRRATLWQWLTPYAGWVALALIYLACRTYAIDDIGAPALVLDARGFRHALAQREMVYLGYLFWPVESWLPVGEVERGQASRLFLNLLVLALVGISAWWWHDRREGARDARAALVFGVLWFLIATIPFMATYASARHLYLATAGLCIASLAVLCRWLPRPRLLLATAAAAIAFCGFQLASTNHSWRQANRLSADISREIGVAAAQASTGDVLLLDVPVVRADRWVWSWASPFALQPPFQDRDIARDLIVLEHPGVYVHPERWHDHPSLTRARARQGRVWLVTIRDDRAHTIEVPADRFDTALTDTGVLFGAPGSFQALVDTLKGASR